jgi:hypothetical protein
MWYSTNNAATIYRGPLLYSLSIPINHWPVAHVMLYDWRLDTCMTIAFPYNTTVLKKYAYNSKDLQLLPINDKW